MARQGVAGRGPSQASHCRSSIELLRHATPDTALSHWRRMRRFCDTCDEGMGASTDKLPKQQKAEAHEFEQ